MLKIQQKNLSGHALRDAGWWAALINNLGLINATRFIMQLKPGTEITQKSGSVP
ncbi:MAG TPA: hypothetical protein VL122_02465 [Nitrospirota bacterium]|nr:hypothetical protein [Nitrospirota bacterium]